MVCVENVTGGQLIVVNCEFIGGYNLIAFWEKEKPRLDAVLQFK